MTTLYDFYRIEEISKKRKEIIDTLFAAIYSVLYDNGTLENLEQVCADMILRNLQINENEPK